MQEAIRAKLKASQPFARAMVSIVCALTLVCGMSAPQFALANERGALAAEPDPSEATQENVISEEGFNQISSDITEGMPVENDATDEVIKADNAASEDADTVTSNLADDSLENNDAAQADEPTAEDEADIQDEEATDESVSAEQSLSTPAPSTEASDARESLATQANATDSISAVFWGTTSGKVVKTIEADANGKYIVKAGEAPTAPATCTFDFSNSLGINFSVTATFEGWREYQDIYSEDKIESLPAIGEYTNLMLDEQFTKDSGAIAYTGMHFGYPFMTFDTDVALQDNVDLPHQSELKSGDVVVFNPVYKIADESIGHIAFLIRSYENGECESIEGGSCYITPYGYVLSDAQIAQIIQDAKVAIGPDKADGYSGIYRDPDCNTVTQLKEPIAYEPWSGGGIAPIAYRVIAFYLDNRALVGESTLPVQGLENARVDVGHVMRDEGASVTVRASKVSPNDQQFADFHSAVQVEGIDDIFDVSLLINNSEVNDNFGELTLQLPVDSKYNGHTLRIHHYHAANDIDTFECIVQNGFIFFSVSKLSLFGIEDLGVANVYKDPVSDSGNSGNAGNAGNAGNVGNAGSTGAPASGATTKPVVNDNVAQQNENIQASAPTQSDAQANASTLPATGDDVSASTFALTALISAALACIASFALRSRKRGLHAR